MAPASFSTLQSLGPVRAGHQLDLKALQDYLRDQAPELFRGAPSHGIGIQVQQFSHGQSNPTFMLALPGSGQRLVLRKKPPGKLLVSAHAVEREYTVMAALSPTGFPVPRPVHLCSTEKPLGTPFYLMECVEGRVFLDPNLPELQPQQRTEMYRHMAQVLAALHTQDPASLGLRSFGNPNHYCVRQLRRWSDQYTASMPSPAPDVTRLVDWLVAHVPPDDAAPPRPAVVHGDFRLDNIVFTADDAAAAVAGPTAGFRPLAVLDWELSTLGNPWADVAYNCLPYHLPPDLVALQRLRRTPSLPAGVPSEREYLSWYCSAAGMAAPPPAHWAFYLALSLFRLLAILAGVQARARQGNAASAQAAQVASDEVLAALASTAIGIIERAEAEVAGEAAGCRCVLPTCTCGSGGGFAAAAAAAGGEAAAAAAAASGGGGCSCSDCKSAAAAKEPKAATSVIASGGANGDAGSSGAAAAAAAAAASRGGALLGISPRAAALREQLAAFMAEHVYPAEEVFEAHAMGPQETRWTVHPLMEGLKAKAKEAGLWNLWLPYSLANRLSWLVSHAAATDPRDAKVLLGAGLSNLDYAHLCELMGRSAWAPEVFNCSAPDTGNMEVLAKYGSREQQLTWLLPLLRGVIRSCFAMTEKAVASSDATNIMASITRSPCGNALTLNGVKWWTSGAMDPRCKVAIFMGKTDPRAAPHKQQSMVLVPMDAPGVKVVRPMLVFGFDDAPHGHAEVHFSGVRVPAANLVLGEGRGFEIAQGRLGPGRLHHCMRLVGAGERAVELMTARAAQRRVFGGPLAAQGAFRATLAQCRIEVDSSRLMVLAAADALDRQGFKGAAAAIAAAKVAAPNAVLRVIDAAIQAHGGAGVSQDFVLARLWTAARTLRIADGPDEVHLGTIAKMELKKMGAGKQARL
ncbi:hypothetical protein VaNZ11_012722 [Volvox africanus]|uniref:Acyl-CoA dehydrogenase n=1 Tax=Volvox africanus TaxID=51714 RepID=A0ABQ5SEI5_9CHLO|nr:hypothetical protein VaNZ11_012722 [Volvox africanus]